MEATGPASIAALLFMAYLGHGATHVYAHNRINATGLDRYTIKYIERAIMANCLLLPPIIVAIWWYRGVFDAWGDGQSLLEPLGLPGRMYLVSAWIALIVLLPGWLIGRWEYWGQRRHQPKSSVVLHADKLLDGKVLTRSWARRLAALPGNVVTQIECNVKAIEVSGLPAKWEGLRIGHFSDVHLTGWYDERFYRLAIDWLRDQRCDLVCFAGDLLDRDHQRDAAVELLTGFDCPHGQHFVLGNHDKRISDLPQLRRRLEAVGWSDVAAAAVSLDTERGRLIIAGNERPWFDAAAWPDADTIGNQAFGETLRLGVAHSPDQYRWALAGDCQLLLCGHTHGGQVRLPAIGPVISPSYYGSRYASGTFRPGSAAMTMHVSRGLAGTQPLRLRCRPEISVLELRVDRRADVH